MLVSPGTPELTVEIYLFVVAALALAAILLGVANALPRAEPALAAAAAAVATASASSNPSHARWTSPRRPSFDLHHRLRPIVREIAAARLARHGVSLDRQPVRARALLGAQAWELVRPDREAPVGRSGRGGCSREELRAIVDALEAI